MSEVPNRDDLRELEHVGELAFDRLKRFQETFVAWQETRRLGYKETQLKVEDLLAKEGRETCSLCELGALACIHWRAYFRVHGTLFAVLDNRFRSAVEAAGQVFTAANVLIKPGDWHHLDLVFRDLDLPALRLAFQRDVAAAVLAIESRRGQIQAGVAVQVPAEEEPFLPLGEAARLAGVSEWRVRKGATKRKRNPLPLELNSNGLPVKPLRARVSDVRAWAARAKEVPARHATKRNAAGKAAIRGKRKASGSQAAAKRLQDGHGDQNRTD